jgi:hypothetical protein
VTNGGVASTLRDAHLRNIETVLLTDGCAAFRPEVHEATLISLGTVTHQMTCAEALADRGGAMSLRARGCRSRILVAPGVYDGLTAALAEAAGFEALYLSGAAVAYTRLGRPDIGLTSMSEMADTMALIRDRVACPSSSMPTPASATRSTPSAPCASTSAPAPRRCRSRTRPTPSAAAISPTSR